MSATIGMNATENSTEVWWPSRYGADDRAGSLNEITPRARIDAAGLVRAGQVFDLSYVLSSDTPAFEGRTFSQKLGTPVGPIGRNKVGWVIVPPPAPEPITMTS